MAAPDALLHGAAAVPMTASPHDLSRMHAEPVALVDLQRPNRKLRRKRADRIKSEAECLLTHRVPTAIIALKNGEIIHGAETAEAYRQAGQTHIPVFYVDDRPPAEIAALRLYLDRVYSEGELDPAAVQAELETICKFDPTWLAATHFTMPEIDFALHGGLIENAVENDEANDASSQLVAVTRTDDLWAWPTGHRMLCGNARHPQTLARLMANAKADLLATDPPYGTTVADISGSHAEWKEGSGMSDDEATAFAADYLRACLPETREGALVFLFIDWKGLYPLLTAVRSAGLVQKTLCTWDKGAMGHGGLYRNQSEHIIVAQHGKAPKGLVRPKRKGRSTIWSAPGYSTFRPDRTQALKDHACTKPQSILMDLLLDASLPGEICLDPFGGSGSMTIAAQRTKRRCYSIEIEERFCDIAVRRMHELTGEYPVHAEFGLPFDEVAAERGIAIENSAAAPLTNTTGGRADG
jgi:DNA modification methylase